MNKLVELKKSEGGIWPYIIRALLGIAASQDFGDLSDAFDNGYKAAISEC